MDRSNYAEIYAGVDFFEVNKEIFDIAKNRLKEMTR